MTEEIFISIYNNTLTLQRGNMRYFYYNKDYLMEYKIYKLTKLNKPIFKYDINGCYFMADGNSKKFYVNLNKFKSSEDIIKWLSELLPETYTVIFNYFY